MVGPGLDGPEYVQVEPQETAIYEFTFIGQNAERSLAGEIYFESGVTGEFWYQINYLPEDPAEETFGPIEAEFGGWAEFEIPFVNQSDVRTTVDIELSSRNFVLDPNEPKSFEIEPNESRKIKFIFIPTRLSDDHKCLVSFKSPHIGCWSVKLTGTGVPPSAFDTTRIATTLNKPVTVMLPFRNPAEEVAHISIELIDIENETNARSGSEILRSVTPNKTLQLLLKRQERIALSPNEVVDIPISFAPEEFTRRDAYVVVELTKSDGNPWRIDNRQSVTSKKSFSAPFDTFVRDYEGKIVGIRFIFPIVAQVESKMPIAKCPKITCEARNRIEQRLELVLSGATPSIHPTAHLRTVTPADRYHSRSSDEGKPEYSYRYGL